MYANRIPPCRIYIKCSKCDRMFPVTNEGKSIRKNCRLHRIKFGKCRDCGDKKPYQTKDFDHNCYHTAPQSCCLIL